MLGYHDTVTGDVFTLKLDVESALSAIAVNYDVTHVRDLIDVYTLLDNIIFNGTAYRVEVKYHIGKLFILFNIKYVYLEKNIWHSGDSCMPKYFGSHY
jgi:hypothetical protein